jgi:hypothetical protein
MAIPNPDPKTIEIDACTAADREWGKAQYAYNTGDYDALDYGYDKAYGAALDVAVRFGLSPEDASELANRAAAGEEDES